jgi:uncharacterized protein YlxW (UPF0749 family)
MKLQNPYKGLFPYSSEDESNFFGRSKEVRDLLEMVKTSQLVILFGESGTGKTSLINAKLFPELIRQYYLPIYIRLNYLGKTSPLEQIREGITSQLRQWDKNVPAFAPHQTLIEYASMTNVFNGLVKPILFFDQFEEYFTLGAKYIASDVLEELITQISDLIELRIPVARRRLAPAGMDDEGISKEELTVNALRFTVVFSLRQDFIGQLEDLKIKIPSINTGRYRIKKFNYAQTSESIVQSAESYAAENKSSPILEPGAAEQIIRQLQAMDQEQAIASDTKMYASTLWSMLKVGFRELFRRKKQQASPNPLIGAADTRKISIDPTILSLYCYQLYEKANKKNGIITNALVSDATCNALIKDYYESSLPEKKYKEAIESTLITPDGRRLLKDLSEFCHDSRLSEAEAVTIRDQTAILRIYGDVDPRQVELAHDQIARQALISKNTRSAQSIKRNAILLLMIAGVFVLLALIATWFYISVQKGNNTLTEVQARNEKLGADLEREQADNRKLKDSISVLNDQYNSLLLRGNVLLTSNQKTNEEIRNLKAQLNKSIYAGRTQTGETQKLNADYQALQKENGNIRYQLDQSQSRARTLSDSVSNYRRRVNELTTDLNECRSANKAPSTSEPIKNRPILQEKTKVPVRKSYDDKSKK